MFDNNKLSNGNLYIISAPSGAGKTSLVRSLLEKDTKLIKSRSYTTRLPRKSEVDGVDYFFISKEEFDDKILSGDFLEHALVFDNQYGMSKSWVNNRLAEGQDIVFEVDWQGALTLKKHYPDNSVSIFILPPSKDKLLQRLQDRNTDNAETIDKRFKIAGYEISKLVEYDFLILNDDFDSALTELHSITQVMKLKLNKQINKYKDHLADWNELDFS